MVKRVLRIIIDECHRDLSIIFRGHRRGNEEDKLHVGNTRARAQET